MVLQRDIGLVGCGEITRTQHGPFLLGPANDTGLRLVATADPRQGLGTGLRHYPDHRAMLDGEPALAAVSIASPTGTHFGVARDALLAGRHVLLEKPPTTTLAELEELAAIATEQGRVLVTSYHARHNEAVERLRERLAGRLPPRRIVIEWREDFHRWHAGQTWPWRAGGLGVFDPGINALSVLCHVLPGLPFHVQRARFRIPPGAETPAFVDMRLTWHGGDGQAVIEWRRGGEDVWDISIDSVDQDGRTEALLLRGVRTLLVDGAAVVTGGEDAEYAGVYRAFHDALERNESSISTQEMRLVEDATAAAEVERTMDTI